jgi:hypothetical protein
MKRERLSRPTRSYDGQDREPIDLRLRRLEEYLSCRPEMGQEIRTAAGVHTTPVEEREVRNFDIVAARKHLRRRFDLKCPSHKTPEPRNWQLRKHNSRSNITESGYRTLGPQPWTARIHAVLRGVNPTLQRSLIHKKLGSPLASSTDSRGQLSLVCAVMAHEN